MSDIKCGFMKKTEGGFFSGDTYHCTKIDNDVPYDTYNRYCTSYSYSDCPNYRYEEPSSGCYLTTVTCDILGLPDNNIYLATLRKFRKDYLQKHPETLQILEQYDFIGPLLAKRIINDKNKKQLALYLFKEYISPIVEKIAFKFDGSYELEIKSYIQMTQMLIKKYGLDTLALTIPGESKYDFNADYSEYGHGRKIKKIGK